MPYIICWECENKKELHRVGDMFELPDGWRDYAGCFLCPRCSAELEAARREK